MSLTSRRNNFYISVLESSVCSLIFLPYIYTITFVEDGTYLFYSPHILTFYFLWKILKTIQFQKKIQYKSYTELYSLLQAQRVSHKKNRVKNDELSEDDLFIKKNIAFCTFIMNQNSKWAFRTLPVGLLIIVLAFLHDLPVFLEITAVLLIVFGCGKFLQGIMDVV